MEHREAVERIAAAVVGPGKLASLEADPSPTGIELRRHLETCSECRSELRAWRLVDMTLAEAAPDDLRAPAEARERILDSVVASGALRGPAARMSSMAASVQTDAPAAAGTEVETAGLSALGDTVSTRDRSGSVAVRGVTGSDAAEAAGTDTTAPRRFTFGRALLAAAAVVALFVAGALLGGPLGLAPVHDDASTELGNVLAYAATVLGQPDHVVASLETPAGAPGGAVAVAPGGGELVVFSDALTPPTDGRRYVCYLERGGRRMEVGTMWFVGTSAYWTGEISDPIDAGRPGDSFIVQLEGSPAAALTGAF